MPAEWEPHEATWLAWPHEKSDWPGKFAPIPWVYGEIVRHWRAWSACASWSRMPTPSSAVRRILKKCHADLDAVEFFHHATNRSWTRDYCPHLREERKPAKSPSRTGASTAGPSTTITQQRRRRPGSSSRASSALPRIGAGPGARRRQHRRERRGEAADHRRMPALRRAGAQSGRLTRAIWSALCATIWACAKSSGWAAESRATTRTATSTTSRASPRSTPW